MPALSRKRAVLGIAALGLVLVALLALYFLTPQREYDPRFDAHIDEPAYAQQRPVVLYDEAHLNVHASRGGYKPFVDLVRNDGYEVQVLREPVTPARLADVAVFVVVCPRGKNDANDEPAFTDEETAAIDQWVRAGGSLLLISDHWPFGPAAQSLAARFGVHVAGGLVQDPKNFEPKLEESHLVFSRDNGLLGDHPITCGRSDAERIDRVLSFTGTSLSIPEEATAFFRLSDSAVDLPPTTPTVQKSGGDVRVSMDYGEPTSAAGRVQALAMEVEKGRVVILGESGMLRAYHDQRGSPVGMNFPGYDNRQLALNIMHWLSRLF